MVLYERTYTLKINLIGIVGNTELQYSDMLENIHVKKVKTITISVYQNDTLNIIKQKICNELLKLIEYENDSKNTDIKKKTCIYCFNNKNNKIISSNDSSNLDIESDDDLFEDEDEYYNMSNESFVIQCNTCKKQYKYRSGLNLSKIKDNKLFLSQPLPVPEFLYLWKDDIICGHSICDSNKSNIKESYNCKNLSQNLENEKEAYNYINIYNFLNEKKILKDISEKKHMDYSIFTNYWAKLSSYRNNNVGKYIQNVLNIETINEKKNIGNLLKIEDKIKNIEDMKNPEKKLIDFRSTRYKLLDNIYKNTMIIDKNRLDFEETLSNFIDSNTTEIEINMAYFPDFYMYYNYLTSNDNIKKMEEVIGKKAITKHLSNFSKLYWPFLNFAKFDNFFQKDDMSYLYTQINNWRFNIKNYDSIIEQFKHIVLPKNFNEKLDFEQYTHKIYVELNGNSKDIIKPSYINLQKVIHLYPITENVPYMTMYLPKESKLIQKMTKLVKKKGIHRQLKWNLEEPNVIQFRMLIPHKLTRNQELYIQIQLYDTKIIRFTINLSSKSKIYIDQMGMKLIITSINKFIKKLNKYNIGNLGIKLDDTKIKLANSDVLNWNSLNSNVSIQSINGSVLTNKLIHEDDIRDKNIINMLYPYIKLDNTGKGSILDFRFLRLEHFRGNEIKKKKDVMIHQILDKYYRKFIDNDDDNKDIRTELTSDEKDKIIEIMQIEFTMTPSQAIYAYNHWNQYKDLLYGKAKGYGILYQLSKTSQIKRCDLNKCSPSDLLQEKYQWCIMGFKSFRQWEYLVNFVKKMIYLIHNIKNFKDIDKKDKNYDIIKYFNYIYNQFDNKFINDDDDDKEFIKNKIVGFSLLKRLKQAYDISLKCPNCGMKIKHTAHKCPFCNIKLDQSQNNLYAKRCSVNRQPIGTGNIIKKNAPKILTIKEHDIKYINKNVNNQIGGATTDIKWLIHKRDRKLQKLQKYKERRKERKDKEKYQLKIDEIDENIKQLNHYISINTRKQDPSRWLDDYDQNEWEDKQITRILIELKIPINYILTKIPSTRNKNNKFKEILLKIFTPNKYNSTYRQRFIEFYGIEDAVSSIKKRYTPKNAKINIDKLLQYHIWKSNKFIKDSKGRNPPGWQKKECLLIWNSLNKNTKHKTLDKITLYSKIVKYFENYENYILKFFTKKEKKEQVEIKNPLDIESYNTKIGKILKPFENGNILEWEGKVIKCPNKKKSKHIYPSFLDIPISKSKNIPNDVEISESDTKKNVCHPCCFINMNKKTKRNLLYCTGIIDKKTHTDMIKNEIKIDDYISSNTSNNLVHTFGLLPKILHKVFNHYTKFDNNFTANIMKSEGFVLMGVDKCIKESKIKKCSEIRLTNDKYFWPAILKYTESDFFELFKNITKYLQENKEEFISLNQGKIYSKFKTRVQRKNKQDIRNINIEEVIQEFLSFIDITNPSTLDLPFDRKYLIDLLSKPGIIHKDGLNIVILRQDPHKLPNDNYNLGNVYTSCLSDIFIEDYYNINKKFIFLYQYKNNTYEPIVLKKQTKKMEPLQMFFDYNDPKYSELMNLIGIWYQKGCSKQYISRKIKRVFYTMFTCQQTLKLFENLGEYDKNLKPIGVFKDYFSRCLYILTTGKYIIPVKPSIYNLGKYPILDLSDNLKKYTKNIYQTISYIEHINDIIDKLKKKTDKTSLIYGSGYEINGVSITNSEINYLVFESQLNIPVKTLPYKLTKNNKIKLTNHNSEINITDIKIYDNETNKLITDGIEWNDFDDIEENIISHERYERLVLEFSQYLNKDSQQKMKEKIISLIKETLDKQDKYNIYKHNNILKKKEKLYELIYHMCLNITTKNKYNITKLKDQNESQIRMPCADIKEKCHSTEYCEISNECKLYIPMSKYKLFIGMMVSEMLKYGKREYLSSEKLSVNVSGRILDNNVNNIVDIDNFIDSVDGVFERNAIISENLLSKIRLNKDL